MYLPQQDYFEVGLLCGRILINTLIILNVDLSIYLCCGILRQSFILVHGQVTIIFVVSVCLFVCLFVCAEFFSAVFDPISIKLGHMLYVWV